MGIWAERGSACQIRGDEDKVGAFKGLFCITDFSKRKGKLIFPLPFDAFSPSFLSQTYHGGEVMKMSTVWLIAIGFLTLIGIIEVIEMITLGDAGKKPGPVSGSVYRWWRRPCSGIQNPQFGPEDERKRFRGRRSRYIWWMWNGWLHGKSAGAWENNTSKSMFVTAGSSKL